MEDIKIKIRTGSKVLSKKKMRPSKATPRCKASLAIAIKTLC